MPRKRWSELSEGARRAIIAGAAVETLLKVAALVDLKRRPPDQVRGSRARWAAAVVLLNSGGAVPLGYFFFGRRRPAAGGSG